MNVWKRFFIFASFVTVRLIETKFLSLPSYRPGRFSFELIDCRDNLSHVVIIKLWMAWKGKTLLRVRFSVWKTAHFAASAFPETLLMRRKRIMNQGFNPMFLKEIG